MKRLKNFRKNFLLVFFFIIIIFGQVFAQETGTVTDIDGNVYKTIKIGNQWWMAENLKVTHYRNGDPIPKVTSSSEWCNLWTDAYCVFDNNESHSDAYGYLYKWYAVGDSRDIAPEGWHVPTDEEWTQLEMYLGMSRSEADDIDWRGTDGGGKMKEAGTTHWNSSNTGATNESGLSVLPGGYRNGNNGNFYGMGQFAHFWSSTEYYSILAWIRSLSYDNAGVARPNANKRDGFSVRCVMDNMRPE